MLQALLDDIVDFSRIEAGQCELVQEPVDPRGILDSVCSMLRRNADAKGLGFKIAVEDLPPGILGDSVRLRQCLFNLVGNAVKFTERGHVEVRAATIQSGQRIRVEVEDTGIGIAADVLPRLFERFRQADASTTRRFGGAGLGLAITRRLARLMGGDVGCVSAEGKGSTFWFEIPVQPAEVRPTPAPSPGDALEGLRVLVVEDNATNRMIATKMLQALGAEVATACDGVEGVEAVWQGGFDLVLMDVQMPRLDGVEATRTIREGPAPCCDVPIVGLTANVLAHQCEAYREAGMNAVVGKPISPGSLLAAILDLFTPSRAPDGIAEVLADTDGHGVAVAQGSARA